jgi:transcription elongation factor
VTLGELLAELAVGLPGIEVSVPPDGATAWSRAGRPFAVVSADGSAAEFGLDPAIAAAAVRTPDVTSSDRGPGWVTFTPAVLDDHAADRAEAWFASAHRRLGPRD